MTQTGTTFTPRLLPPSPSIHDVHTVAPQYAAITVQVMSHIADRSETNRYPGLIDTKFDIVTGDDFPADAPHGPNTVYGWIQGRALEALAQHCRWLKEHPWADASGQLATRLDSLITAGAQRLQHMRAVNNGRLYFFMEPSGPAFRFNGEGRRRPHRLDTDSPYSFSDLFGSRGLYAAAAHMNDDARRTEALCYCDAVEEAIRHGTFVSDQQNLPPQTTPAAPPGKVSHAPFTIFLATPHLIARGENDPGRLDKGLAFIEHVVANHYNAGRDIRRQPHDFWEFVDTQGVPWQENDILLCDPGHTLELAGLGLKLVAAAKNHGIADDRWQRAARSLRALIGPTFQLGYQPAVAGIAKSINLTTRRPVDASMPWWSLPETMRAAIYGWSLAPDEEEKRLHLQVFARCHNAFVTNYVLPQRHLFAVQNRGPNGNVIRTIPATADADPGYHTGLCLLDVMDVIEDHSGPIKKR